MDVRRHAWHLQLADDSGPATREQVTRVAFPSPKRTFMTLQFVLWWKCMLGMLGKHTHEGRDVHRPGRVRHVDHPERVGLGATRHTVSKRVTHVLAAVLRFGCQAPPRDYPPTAQHSKVPGRRSRRTRGRRRSARCRSERQSVEAFYFFFNKKKSKLHLTTLY